MHQGQAKNKENCDLIKILFKGYYGLMALEKSVGINSCSSDWGLAISGTSFDNFL